MAAETIGVAAAIGRIVIVVRIAIQYEIVGGVVDDEETWPLVFVQVEAFEDIVAGGTFHTNAPRFVHVLNNLSHAAHFQAAKIEPTSGHAETANAGYGGEIEEIENGFFVLVGEVIDAIATGSAFVEQDAGGVGSASEIVLTAANPNSIAWCSGLLTASQRCEGRCQRAEVAIASAGGDVELCGKYLSGKDDKQRGGERTRPRKMKCLPPVHGSNSPVAALLILIDAA